MNEARNRVVIGIDPSNFASDRLALLRELAKHSIQLAMIEIIPQSGISRSSASRMFNATFLSGTALTSTYDSLIGGIAIQTDHAAGAGGGSGDCTAGFTAYHNGYRAVVTATHCTTVWGAPDNTIASQVSAGRRIGVEYVDPNKYHCGLNWCRASDASLFRLDDSVPSLRGLIARTTARNGGGSNGGNGPTTIDAMHPYFIISGAGTSLNTGMEVQKMGRTSGWTYGTVTSTCVDHHYDKNETGLITTYTTVCNFDADIEVVGGDSGGPMFRWSGGDSVTLEGTTVGTLSTSDGVFSKFSRIASDMGGTLVVTKTGTIPTLTVSISGPTPVRTNQTTCTWTANAAGGVLAYSYAWKKNGSSVGTNSQFLTLPSTGTTSFTLQVDVTDAEHALKTSTLSVSVSGAAPACQF